MRPETGRGDDGFTLLEVMIAFVIAALALSLLYQGATGGLRATASATRTEEAVSLAKSHLAAIGRGEGIAQQETSGEDGDGFSWHLHIQPIGDTPIDPVRQRPRQRHQAHRRRALRRAGDARAGPMPAAAHQVCIGNAPARCAHGGAG